MSKRLDFGHKSFMSTEQIKRLSAGKGGLAPAAPIDAIPLAGPDKPYVVTMVQTDGEMKTAEMKGKQNG